MSNQTCKITGIRAINGGKVELQFSQQKGSTNILGMFNASDPRFSASKGRKAWMSAMPEDAKALLANHPTAATLIDSAVAAGVGAPRIECELEAILANGVCLSVQITETHEPHNDWQKDNILTSIKRAGNGTNGSSGNVLLAFPTNADGTVIEGASLLPIFSSTEVVAHEAVDVVIRHTAEMPYSEFTAQLTGVQASATVNAEQVS